MQSHVFRDFEAFAESIRGVDSTMMFRNLKNRVWKTNSIDLNGINLQFGFLGSGNIAQGQLHTDGVMFYVPLTKNVEYTANGTVLRENSVAILEPGCEFCVSTKVEHDWCAAFIPNYMFTNSSDSISSRLCRVTHIDQQIFNQFKRISQQILSTAIQCPEFELSLAARQASVEIFDLCSSLVSPSEKKETDPEGRPKLPREEIIRRSMHFMQQHVHEQLSVRDLVEAAEVSERTLRTAFKEYFGIGPARYLNLRRLHDIRSSLQELHYDEVTVSKVLIDHGEYAFSRFASRYQKLFGELPSETLRKRKTNN